MIGDGMFLSLHLTNALSVMMLGFIGGTLSGSNITHKFGKALMGWKKHGEMGNVDKKLGLYLVATSFIGIRIAVWLNSTLFEIGGGKGGSGGSALGDLYISGIFIFVLSIVSVSILRDALKSRDEGEGPSTKIAEFIGKLHLPPFIYFHIADVRVSLWILAIIGLLTGYLAGTIGVGGFIGVPAMIYVFGIPTTVAAGTELFLAMFMGAWGAINYAWGGYVDIRLVLLLYTSSLIGIYIGAFGTKVVKEKLIRLVTGSIILLCVISRGIAVPMYLRQLNVIDISQTWDAVLNGVSQGFLYAAGISGTGIIIISVARAYYKRMKVQASLTALQ